MAAFLIFFLSLFQSLLLAWSYSSLPTLSLFSFLIVSFSIRRCPFLSLLLPYIGRPFPTVVNRETPNGKLMYHPWESKLPNRLSKLRNDLGYSPLIGLFFLFFGSFISIIIHMVIQSVENVNITRFRFLK